MSDSATPQEAAEQSDLSSDVELPGAAADEVEYNGPEGEFGSAEEAEIDDFEVDEDDEEWGL